MNQEEFSKKIKDIRKKNNMTQAEFADSLGVTFQAVSKWENSKNMPDIAILKEISNKFHIDMNELMGTKNKKTTNKNIEIFLSFLVVIFIGVIFCFYIQHDDSFEFKTISSGCSAFKISGSIAYNDYRTALHITNIDYCDGDDEELYSKIECSLLLIDNNTETLLSTYKKDDKKINLEDFLKDLSFDIDSKYHSCSPFKDNKIELKIEAYDENNKITNYIVPLTFNTCK